MKGGGTEQLLDTDAGVRLRLTKGQLASTAAAAAVGALIAQLLFLRHSVGESLLTALVFALGATVGARLLGVTLTGRSLRLHDLSGRHIPWSSIESIEDTRALGMQRVVVVEHSGRRVHLRAPVNGVLMRDREFVQKLRLLDEYLTSARQSQG